MSEQRVTVRLSEDEAIVLMEWLFRLSERRDFNEIVSEPAERVAIWALHGSLETQSTAVFAPGYQQALTAARERLAPPGSEFRTNASGSGKERSKGSSPAEVSVCSAVEPPSASEFSWPDKVRG
jgi:hypothetical protein